jgi:flagellar biogenesis protein FliO
MEAAVLRWKANRAGAVETRRLSVVETLTLGPKKQLLLVNCAGESFLVGVGAEGVQTMVRVQSLGAGESL